MTTTRNIGLAVLFIFLLWVFIHQFNKWKGETENKNKLRGSKNAICIPGKINFFSSVSKSHLVVANYEFKLHGKAYINDRKLVKLKRDLPETPFNVLIIFDSLHPKINFLLVTKSDFKYYNKVIPDSISYITEYFDNPFFF